MKNRVEILSQFMTFMYLNYEFGPRNFKITTVLDDNNCWTNKVILEATDEPAKDDVDFVKFYKEALDIQKEV